jgi:hypothetical protein
VTALALARRHSRKGKRVAMHPISVMLSDREWEALRGIPRTCRCLTDDRLIGGLLTREEARIIKQDEQLRALRQALIDSKTGNAQG